MNGLSPDIEELLNNSRERRKKSGLGPSFCTTSGGFVPYSTYIRRTLNLGSALAPPMSGSTSLHVSDTAHWVSRHQVSIEVGL